MLAAVLGRARDRSRMSALRCGEEEDEMEAGWLWVSVET